MGDARFRIGIDIGGTFTDIFLTDALGTLRAIAKTPTTPADPSEGVEIGLHQICHETGISPGDVSQIVHGTTLVTNALIERKGALTGMLTTRGFRDVIAMGREHRYDLYDLKLELPEPLVPRWLRLEVPERVAADGRILEPLDVEEARRQVACLLSAGVQAIAVCLLHSYRNPRHEQVLRDIIDDMAPDVYVSLSSEVVPELREYERFSTTVANVYVRPVVDRYLQRLEQRLRDLGFRGSLLIMLSNGGTCTVDVARKLPIWLVESGPAAGALVAAYLSIRSGTGAVLSFDMGGTTAKACIVEGGRPLVTSDYEVARLHRFKKGSGLPVKVPVIDMIEIGAGGGSIAWIDQFGLLRVGPESAGADPGPACYGWGGEFPTVTDADLVLGYLDPDYFLGGRLQLDMDRALVALERVARPLGMDVAQVAWGIHQLVNENMAAAARIHAIERGKDVRGFPMVAFGGAGPVHAYGIARILRLQQVWCPPGSGVASAQGLLVAPVAFDLVHSWPGLLEALKWDEVNGILEEMEQQAKALVLSAGVAGETVSIARWADMRYVGQGYHVTVPVPLGRLSVAHGEIIGAAFADVYKRLYGRLAEGVGLEVLSWRVTASGPSHQIVPGVPRITEGPALKGERKAYFPELGGFVKVPVFSRYALDCGDTLRGPAIVEEEESTLIVGPGAWLEVDEMGILRMEINYG
jgi:N-methylhydantoinase A